MEAFSWDQRFETGIAKVDQQHRHLVDLVNLAGDILLEGKASEEELQKLFGQLANYAIDHFNEEETLMAKTGVDSRHVDSHKTQHAEFLKQVTTMWNNRGIAENPSAMLHGFLSSWLTVHILGQDQEMARMISRMQAGMAAAEAYEAERKSDDQRISPLLDALHRLYVLLSVQNRELADANTNLESKVLERTRELQAAGEQLLQSEKLASLGRMVAGFAHEINTPVGIALSAISQSDETIKQLNAMLSQDEVSEEDLASHLDTLQKADRLAVSNLQRAAELVRSFKRTSIDQTSEQSRDFNFRELIQDVISNLHNQFKNTRITIDINCPENIVVRGLPGLIEQLLTNLMLNSLKHAFAEGTLPGKILIKIPDNDGKLLELNYTDDGVGMPEDVAEKAFEPFFTTTRGKGGSGLGLYVCYNIVTAQLKGSISLDSTPGKGSHFIIRFPCERPVNKEAST